MCNCQNAGNRCKGAECWKDIPTEEVTFDVQRISLPHQLILPLPVANQAKSLRKIALTEPTMILPTAIVTYIREHPTYHVWIAA